MHPFLIDLYPGPKEFFLPSYGLLFALGVTLAWIWFARRARTLELPDDTIFNLTFYTLIGGILGAKLLLVAVDWRDYAADPKLLLGTIRTAGVLVGGVAAGAVVFVVYARRCGLPLMRLTDAVVAPLALAQALGRFGCFSAGCCYGVPTDADHPLAVVFTHPRAIASGRFAGQPLIAVQLVEAIFDLVLAGLLTVAWRRRLKPEGTVLGLYLLLYGAARFTLEFFRGDIDRGLYFGDRLSTSQLFTLAAALTGLALLVRGRLAARSDRAS